MFNKKSFKFMKKFLHYKTLRKFLLTMKISIALSLICVMSFASGTYSQDHKMSLKLSRITVKELLKTIESQSEFSIFYKDDNISASRVIDVNCNNCKVGDILNTAFAGTNLSYRIIDKIIVVSDISQFATTIKGQVLDKESGQPIPGVNVMEKGTTNGTISDVDGNFTIDVADAGSAVLIFSFIGYELQEVAVNGSTNLTVSLATKASEVDEVVVVGYGVKKKSLVTGSISSVKSDEIKTTSTSRIDQAIQGKTAGVMVLPQSGAPGSTTNIRVRGVGSNQGSNPIYMVNGMRVRDLNSINPGDIESIEILKDAASSAIYGAEGANGVILVTLKGGKSDKMQISYDFQYGVQRFKTKMKMMDATQYKQFQQEAGLTVSDRFGANTNWTDELFDSAPMQQHHISFSGGSEKTQYLISGSYINQDGIIGGSKSKYTRYTTLINVKSDVKKWLEIGGNFNYMHSSQNGIVENSEYSSVAGSCMIMDPLTPIFYTGTPAHVAKLISDGQTMIKDGSGNYYAIGENITGEMINPFITLATTHNNTVIDQMTGTGYGTLKPLKGLSITSRIGIDVAYGLNHVWTPKYYGSPENQNSLSWVRDNLTINTRWVWDNFATYALKLGDHAITTMVGYSAQKASMPNTTGTGNTQFNTLSLTSQPMVFEGDDFATQGGTTDRNSDAVGGFNRISTMASVFGRLSYDYKGKYMFEGSVRRDGASEFPTDAKYGVFPAVSAGWVLSNEDFLKIDALSYLKVRASWGKNGSRSNLTGNEDKELWNLNTRYPDASGNFVSGGWITRLPNKDLRWETSVQTDLGIDVRLLKDKVSFTLDYFNRETQDLIAQGLFPYSTGNVSPNVNLGDVSNKGLEIELGYRNDDHEFKYAVNANVSFVKNKVTKLAVLAPVDGTGVRNRALTRFENGEPIWYFRGYKTDGVLADDAAATAYNTKYGTDFSAGDLKVVDANGDGKISSNDITKIGDPNPDMIYGGNIAMSYKGFDFNLVLQGTKGNDIYMAWFREDRQGSNKPAYFFEDRWTPTNPNASMPKPNNSSLYLYNGDKMIGDGSYMRVKQIQLGYTLPASITKSIGLNSLRAYVSLDDYITFTKYKGLDPEVGSNQNSLQGVDRGRYPVAGRFVFGLSVNF